MDVLLKGKHKYDNCKKSSKMLKKKMKNSIFKRGNNYSNDKWFLKKLIVKTQICKIICELIHMYGT